MSQNIKQVIKREYLKCAQDPVHFMRKFCTIQHPQKGKVKFDLYPFQERCLKEFKDSVNTELIEKLENQIYMYIDLSKNDSLLILKQDEKILLLEDQVELYKQLQPKWWEKPLWFSSGLIITWIFK